MPVEGVGAPMLACA